MTIDRSAVPESRRLDWRTDDAYLPDDKDPPMHAILVSDSETIRFRVRRARGDERDVDVRAAAYSARDAIAQSVKVFVHDGARVGYIHFWYLHMTGVPEALQAALDSSLRNIDVLLLDLRGRGGSAPVVPRLLRLLEEGPERRFDGPVVALIDRQSRSGKEALAYELRSRNAGLLVGEPTAGAVIPAAFADVGDYVLMFPPMTLPTYTERLELRPTPPDLHVTWGGPLSGDRDPILEAGIREAWRQVGERGAGRVLPRREQVARRDDVRITIPTMTELLASMTAAFGGPVALNAHREMTMSGTARIIDTPITGTFVARSSPVAYESTMELAGGIRIIESVDGDGEWVSPPGSSGRQRLQGTAALPMRWQALFAGPLQFAQVFPEAIIEGAEVFDDRACIRVRLGGHDNDAVYLIVDAQSWLPRGLRYKAPSQIGVLDVTTYYRSYRNTSGVMVPDLIINDAGAQQLEIKLERIERH